MKATNIKHRVLNRRMVQNANKKRKFPFWNTKQQIQQTSEYSTGHGGKLNMGRHTSILVQSLILTRSRLKLCKSNCITSTSRGDWGRWQTILYFSQGLFGLDKLYLCAYYPFHLKKITHDMLFIIFIWKEEVRLCNWSKPWGLQKKWSGNGCKIKNTSNFLN